MIMVLEEHTWSWTFRWNCTLTQNNTETCSIWNKPAASEGPDDSCYVGHGDPTSGGMGRVREIRKIMTGQNSE